MTDELQYAESQRRENLVEHCLVAELLQDAWLRRRQPLDILRSEVDAAGYDLVLNCNGATRHVQVKSSLKGSKTAFQGINGRLAEVPSGCVVWVRLEEDRASNRVNLEYRWFGDAPGQPLPDLGERRVRHARGNSQGAKGYRQNTFRLTRGKFAALANVQELSDRLFGPP